MKIFLVIFGYLTVSLCLESSVEKEIYEGTCLDIPLLDLGVLWMEEYLTRRKKRSPSYYGKGKQGLLDKIFQGKTEEKLDEELFVDSLLGMISKADPALLSRLKERMRKFEEKQQVPLVHQAKSVELPTGQHPAEKRPLIQFFNVTRISVGVPDDYPEDEIDPKKPPEVEKDGSADTQFTGPEAHRLPKREQPIDPWMQISNSSSSVKVSWKSPKSKIKISKVPEKAKHNALDTVVGKRDEVSNVYRVYTTNVPKKLSMIV